MRKNIKAFTLAEVLMVMLILSIIMAAFAPMMTTRNKVDNGSPWKYANNNSDIYYGLGTKQTAIIGQKSVSNSDPLGRLVISTNGDAQKHVVFKKNGTYLGHLHFTDNSVALGRNALFNAPVEAVNNTAIGQYALANIGDSDGNTAVGYMALAGNTNGSGANSAFGTSALMRNTTGYNNVAIGYYALGHNVTGADNVALGHNSCYYVTGSNKICIGDNSGPADGSANASSNVEQIFIGRTSQYNNAEAALLITNTASGAIDLNLHTNARGNLIVYGAYSNPSDKRLKNIKGENKSGLAQIRELKVFDYTLKDDKSKTPRVGVIAQDLQKIFPNAVGKTDEGFLSVRQEDMFFAMINAIKEIDTYVQGLITETKNILAKIKDFNSRLTAQEQKIKSLEKQNAELEARLKKLEEKL